MKIERFSEFFIKDRDSKRLSKPTILFISTLIASGSALATAIATNKSSPTLIKGIVGTAATIIGGGNLFMSIKARPKNPTGNS